MVIVEQSFRPMAIGLLRPGGATQNEGHCWQHIWGIEASGQGRGQHSLA